MMKRYNIFNIPIDNVNVAEALEIAKEMLVNGKQYKIFTLNPEILLLGRKNQNYKKVLQSAELALPDGIGLVWLGRFLGIPFKERVAGVDFMEKLTALAERHKKSVFFLGGENEAAEKTARVLKDKYPNLLVAGWLEDIDYWKNCGRIFQADVLFIALGAPKQETWIHNNLPKLPNLKIVMAVGGAFDILSGKIKRAPFFLRKIGLEWLWRFLMEPRKRWKRIFKAVIFFPLQLLLYAIKREIKIQKSKCKMQNDADFTEHPRQSRDNAKS